jgi:UDP-N-acetylmuramoyl-tripeptide--D-alanyl-D-alanine ligase
LWTVAEVVAATGGRPENLDDGPISAVSIDSRDIVPEALFIAIRGDSRDGHDFVVNALSTGAAAAIVSEDYFAARGGDNLIVVPDTLKALQDLGAAARARSRAEIVAVTGSAGKTTTKEAIRTVLGSIGETHASVKSFNNHWGVPLTLARMPREAQFGVFEIGMNHPGEITPLVRLVRPHIAVITTVAAAHLEFFASIADIAAAKAEIFLGLEPGGAAVLNADHDYLHILFNKARHAGVGRVVTYGFDETADWRVSDVETLPTRTIAQLHHAGEVYGLSLQVPGRHMVANAVAAVVVAYLAGEGTAAPLRALAGFSAAQGRGEIIRLGPPGKPLLLVDESYNANLASMTAALDVYAAVRPPAGKKVLVLGDMLELGARSAELHATLKDVVLRSCPDKVFLVGSPIESLARALHDEVETAHGVSVEAMSDTILAGLAHGDSVMVKGSKGVRLADLVQAIRNRFK